MTRFLRKLVVAPSLAAVAGSGSAAQASQTRSNATLLPAFAIAVECRSFQ